MQIASLRYLVVGTGRSGTVSVAKALTSMGIPCTHERIFDGHDIPESASTLEDNGGNSACSAHCGLSFVADPVAESSYMAVPFLDHPLLQDCTIVHVVRDPLKVISSFLNHILFFRRSHAAAAPGPERFIRKHLPHLDLLPDAASRACYYYLRWNQWIEESTNGRRHFLHRIETGPEPLANFLGVEPPQGREDDKTCNAYQTWPDHLRVASDLAPISDEEIQTSFLWKEVATLANRYGYSYATKFSPHLNRTTKTAQAHENVASELTAIRYSVAPMLIEEGYHGYNLVQWQREFIGVRQDVGPLNLLQMDPHAKNSLRETGRLLIAGGLETLKLKIMERVAPALERMADQWLELLAHHTRGVAAAQRLGATNIDEYPSQGPAQENQSSATDPCANECSRNAFPILLENYRGFNLVAFRGKVLALAQAAGPIDLQVLPTKQSIDRLRRQQMFIAESTEEAKRWIDERETASACTAAPKNLRNSPTLLAKV